MTGKRIPFVRLPPAEMTERRYLSVAKRPPH
jgi:hypothetical protein